MYDWRCKHFNSTMKDKYRWLEITAVLITGAGKLVFDDSPKKNLFIIAALAFWIGYLTFRRIKEERICKYCEELECWSTCVSYARYSLC